MTGFEPILVTRRSTPRGAGVIGRFSVPDLDAPDLPAEPLPDPAALAEAALQAQLADAREAGAAEGAARAQAEAEASLAAREAAALEAIRAALEAAVEQARDAAGEAAEALARLLLAALDAALPEAAARVAPEAIVRLAAALRPLIAEGVAVTLRVPPGCAVDAAARIPAPAPAIEEDPALPPGDAAASWRGGGASLSLEARRAAIAELLTAFHLVAPPPEES